MRPIRNKVLLIISICFCCHLHGQSFRNKAAIDTITKAGFYGIKITPLLSSYVKTDFGDLRITDERGTQIPYILKSSIQLSKADNFKPLKIISNKISDSGESILIIENNPADKIDGFSLRIKNTEVSRTINISGSDKMTNWFSIAENINLGTRYITDSDSYLENISFPLSSYRYYRIIIYNRKNDPLNIVTAERHISNDVFAPVPVVPNPPTGFLQKDSNDHTSYITVLNPNAFHISYIRLRVNGPRYFKRNVDVLSLHHLFGNFIISSDSIFVFSLPLVNDSVFTIKIYNGDNPSLRINAVSTGQDAEKIIAYLEPGKNYKLEMTNEKAVAPNYDLSDFKHEIPSTISDLAVSAIVPVASDRPVKTNTIFSQAWLWVSMIAVLLILLVFTLRLVKEVGKRS